MPVLLHVFGHLDPDRDPSITKQNIKNNHDSSCFVTSFYFLSLKNDVNVLSKGNKQKTFLKLVFCWHLEGQ